MNVGLIFGVIVAIMMMGLIIVFGYDQIMKMLEMQTEAEINNAINELTSAVDRVHSLSGETSEPFRLSFPAEIVKVCFLPSYRGMSISTKRSWLSNDLRSIIDDSYKTKYQLADNLVKMRISPKTGGGFVDNNLTLLAFRRSTAIPRFEEIPYLGPSKKTANGGPEVLCVPPASRIWLQRRFDEHGAWVDVEES